MGRTKTDGEAPAAKPAKKAAKKKTKAQRSHLEVGWIREWTRQGGPELVEEYQFHAVRKWRADFANMQSRILIEIEGGAYNGRHTRAKGFMEDADKYLTAHLHGWEVIRVAAHQVRGDIITAVIGRMRVKCAEALRRDGWTDGRITAAGFAGEKCAEAPGWLGAGEG